MDAMTLQALIERVLDDHKANDITAIDLTGKADFADSMVIASGTSQRHVASLADHVIHALKDAGFEHVPAEGQEAGEWVLVDAGDVIVHIFHPEARSRYNLEKMWSLPAANAELKPRLTTANGMASELEATL